MSPELAVPVRYRMGELCTLTGLPRQVIHFYIHEGLLPEGTKTGKTTTSVFCRLKPSRRSSMRS